MKNGFTFLGIMSILLGVSGTALTHVSSSTETSAIAVLDANAALAVALPAAGVGTCVNCRPCTFEYWSGDKVPGHYASASGVTTGTGLGNEHECAIGQPGDFCTNSANHPAVVCSGGQAALPPMKREQLAALAQQLADGSADAYRVLLRDFSDQVTIDHANRAVLFKGCQPGAYTGILPIPAGVV